MAANGKNISKPSTHRITDGTGRPEDRFFRVYHPTKGWRRMSLKRGVAQSIVSGRVYLRGHAIARMIAHGY